MIYLDNNATTALDAEVFDVMKPLLESQIGNPSSIHRYGQAAKAKLLEAIQTCAHFFQVHTDEIYFTSGATEALNFLLRSMAKGSHVISSSLEHAAVIEPLKVSDATVTFLDPFPGKGSIQPDQVREAIRKETALIVLSAANNETGIKTEVSKIADIASHLGIPFLVDGVALLGKEAFQLPLGATAACFSGHKIHGPLGVGIAVVKKKHPTKPLILGGSQQRGFRAGTENLPAIVGFAKALELLREKGAAWHQHMADLQTRFERKILESIPDAMIHGKDEPRICNTSNISFPGTDGETLLITLDLAGIAASHGSACSSGALSPSRILSSMGIAQNLVQSSIRFSFSRFTTIQEIDKSVEIISESVRKLRVLVYSRIS
jgi:cysteine desulfurase